MDQTLQAWFTCVRAEVCIKLLVLWHFVGLYDLFIEFEPEKKYKLEQNIRFSSILYNVSAINYRNRLKLFSQTLAIEEFLHEISSNVSYGIQKRAMLVRALIHNPEILVLDEPTGFMDAPSSRLTWDLLKKIKGEKSIIYVSNSLPEVEQAHDRILVFKDGRIIMDGNLDKLLESTLDYHQFQIENN